jgi:hypothetical protein
MGGALTPPDTADAVTSFVTCSGVFMSITPPSGERGLLLNKANIAAAPAAVKPRERDGAITRPDKQWKPYPCLLTRREIRAIIAEQLG